MCLPPVEVSSPAIASGMLMPASACIDLRLQVGRVLSGHLLAGAVLLRELLTMPLGGMSGLLAPAWVVVTDTSTKRELFRVATGREADAGPATLRAMQADAAHMALEDFKAKWEWQPRNGLRRLRGGEREARR